jgi:hypothetical protein
MPPDSRIGPAATPGRSQDSPPPSASSVLTVAQGTDAARELDAWAAAVVHLHRAGLPAAVPPFAAAWLRRRGVAAHWVSAA